MWPEPDSCIDPNFGWGQPFQGSLGHGASTGTAVGEGWGEKPVCIGALEQATAFHLPKCHSQPGT